MLPPIYCFRFFKLNFESLRNTAVTPARPPSCLVSLRQVRQGVDFSNSFIVGRYAICVQPRDFIYFRVDLFSLTCTKAMSKPFLSRKAIFVCSILLRVSIVSSRSIGLFISTLLRYRDRSSAKWYRPSIRLL